MNWITVKKFPLETDLSAITHFLHQRKIVHTIYEEAGEQVVAVADPKLIEPVAQFIDEVMQGHLTLVANEYEPTIKPEFQTPTLAAQLLQVPVTSLFIVLSILGALIVGFDSNFAMTHWLLFQDIQQDAYVPLNESLAHGEYWRLLTPIFLHFSPEHVIFNSVWVWFLGRRLELLLGRGLFFWWIILTGIVSNSLSYAWYGPEIFGGMSAVVYAMVGFIFISQKLSPHPLTQIAPMIMGVMLISLALGMSGLLDFISGASVGNAAHVFGLMTGCGFALVRSLFFKIK